MTRRVESSTPFLCSGCKEQFQLGSWCREKGEAPQEGAQEDGSNRLPWLVVKDFEAVTDLVAAVNGTSCQRCLDYQGAAEHGLMNKLEELGMTVVRTGLGVEVAFLGVPVASTRAPGFQQLNVFDPSAQEAWASTELPMALPMLTPSSTEAPAVPLGLPVFTGGSGSGAPTAPIAFTGVAVEGVEPWRPRPREERPRRVDNRPPRVFIDPRGRNSRTTIADAVAGRGLDSLQALKRTLPRDGADAKRLQKQRRFDERLVVLAELVTTLKRSRKGPWSARLKAFGVQLDSTMRTDPERRPPEAVLAAAGAKRGWLAGRFVKHLVSELYARVLDGTEVLIFVDSGEIVEALGVLGVTAEDAREALALRFRDLALSHLHEIRAMAEFQDVTDLVEQLLGWATYVSILTKVRRSKVLLAMGTSVDKLERLSCLFFSSAAPKEPKGGSGGFEHTAEGGKVRELRTLKLEGEAASTVEVVTVRPKRQLDRPPKPLPKVPAGTSGEGIVPGPVPKIVYPDGERFGEDAVIVFADDRHVRTLELPVEIDEQTHKVREVSILGAGQRSRLQVIDLVCRSTVDARRWSYWPLDGDDDLQVLEGFAREVNDSGQTQIVAHPWTPERKLQEIIERAVLWADEHEDPPQVTCNGRSFDFAAVLALHLLEQDSYIADEDEATHAQALAEPAPQAQV